MGAKIVELLRLLWNQQREELGENRGRLAVTPSGFNLTVPLHAAGRRQSTMPWLRIGKVIAFKEQWSGREIPCLAVINKDSQVMILDATMAGWLDFVTHLQAAVPTIVPFDMWYPALTSPGSDIHWARLYDTKF